MIFFSSLTLSSKSSLSYFILFFFSPRRAPRISSCINTQKESKKIIKEDGKNARTAFAFATISTEMKIKNTNESECCSVFSPHSFGYEFFSLSQHTKKCFFFFVSYTKNRRRDEKLCVAFTFTHILNHKFPFLYASFISHLS